MTAMAPPRSAATLPPLPFFGLLVVHVARRLVLHGDARTRGGRAGCAARGADHGLRGITHDAGLGAGHGAHGHGAADDARGLGHLDGAAGGIGVEDIAELVGGLEAIGCVFLHALEDDALQRGVHAGVDLRGRNGQLVDLLEGDGDGVVAVKGNAAGGALVHHHAQRVDVAGGAQVLATRLLGRDVVGGAQHVVVLGEVAVLGTRDAEVHYLDVAVGQHHDVLRLDVAMDDLMLVGHRERPADLGADLGDLLGVEGPVAADAALEVGAAQVLHDDVVRVAVLTPVVHADDIGALQTCGRLRLLLKARRERRVAGILRQHDLDRDGAVQDLVLSAEHARHASVANFVLEQVPASKYALSLCHLSYSSPINPQGGIVTSVYRFTCLGPQAPRAGPAPRRPPPWSRSRMSAPRRARSRAWACRMVRTR